MPSLRIPLLITIKGFLNFFSMQSLNKYLANRKHTNAPNEDAKDANTIPGKRPNKAPINKHNIPAKGNAKTEIKK